MWIVYAAGSSFFAGITAVLAKCGIRKTEKKELAFICLSGLAAGAS